MTSLDPGLCEVRDVMFISYLGPRTLGIGQEDGKDGVGGVGLLDWGFGCRA